MNVGADRSGRHVPVIAGALYMLIIGIGLWRELGVRGLIVVSGDASASAANLQRMASLWRLSVAGEFVLLICATILAAVFYRMLRPVGRELALLALLFNLVAVAVEGAVAMYLVGALLPLGSAPYLTAFEPGQLHALAGLALRTHEYGFGAALIFFGCFCLFAGAMMYRSGYVPRAIGVLMQLAGSCYLINSFALIVSPALAGRLFPLILVPAFIGELSLAGWLLFRADARWWTRAEPQPDAFAPAVAA